jgi:NAD(P)-dependent dehydrogenase (short-subunit alcohol dehydrogenase family)
MLSRAFLPYKKTGGIIIAYSSGFAFLPPALPFLSKSSAYSISKMGTARFYEFLAVENPDLTVFILQPGVVRTALYEKGELDLEATIDTSKLECLCEAYFSELMIIEFNFPHTSQCGWQAPRPNHSLDAFCLPTGMWSN